MIRALKLRHMLSLPPPPPPARLSAISREREAMALMAKDYFPRGRHGIFVHRTTGGRNKLLVKRAKARNPPRQEVTETLDRKKARAPAAQRAKFREKTPVTRQEEETVLVLPLILPGSPPAYPWKSALISWQNRSSRPILPFYTAP
jgi:hypothetical protein